MKRFYAIGFLILVAFDTLAQISFKVAGEHALPLEFSGAWLLRVFAHPLAGGEPGGPAEPDPWDLWWGRLAPQRAVPAAAAARVAPQ